MRSADETAELMVFDEAQRPTIMVALLSLGQYRKRRPACRTPVYEPDAMATVMQPCCSQVIYRWARPNMLGKCMTVPIDRGYFLSVIASSGKHLVEDSKTKKVTVKHGHGEYVQGGS